MGDFSLTIKSGDVPKSEKIRINITRLSYITGYDKSHISRVFARKSKPSVTCLEKLAKALGLGFEELHVIIAEGRIDVAKGR